MPYKRRYKKKYRKKNRIPRAIAVNTPNRVVIKLPYASQGSIDATAGNTMALKTIALNDLYDPDKNPSFINAQPNFYDQWMAMYSKATVIGAEYDVVFMAKSDNPASANGMVGTMISNSSSFSSNLSAAIANRYSKFKPLGGSNGNAATQRITGRWSAKKWFGVQSVLDETDFNNTTGSGPNRLAYLNLCSGAGPSATDISAIDVIVKVTYLVVFHEPYVLNQS